MLQLEALREQYEEQVAHLKEELQHERTARQDVAGTDREGEAEVSTGETSLFLQVWQCFSYTSYYGFVIVVVVVCFSS